MIGHTRRSFHQALMLGAEGIRAHRIQCNDGPMPIGPLNRYGERATQGSRLYIEEIESRVRVDHRFPRSGDPSAHPLTDRHGELLEMRRVRAADVSCDELFLCVVHDEESNGIHTWHLAQSVGHRLPAALANPDARERGPELERDLDVVKCLRTRSGRRFVRGRAAGRDRVAVYSDADGVPG